MAGSSVDPIERLFRDWAALTQKSVDVSAAPAHFQAQNDILDNLFNTLSARSNLSADLSVGLVKGIVASEYGTLQPGRESWEQDPAVARLAARVRDLLVIIGLQALCIGQIVRRAGLDVDKDEEDDEAALPQSREDISAVNMVLLDHTMPLVDPTLPVYLPTAVCSLACSILLNSVPSNYRPPTPGIDLPIQHEFARRAFEPRGEIFGWIEAILNGPLFDLDDNKTEKALRAEYRQRKLVKGEQTACYPEEGANRRLDDGSGRHDSAQKHPRSGWSAARLDPCLLSRKFPPSNWFVLIDRARLGSRQNYARISGSRTTGSTLAALS